MVVMVMIVNVVDVKNSRTPPPQDPSLGVRRDPGGVRGATHRATAGTGGRRG